MVKREVLGVPSVYRAFDRIVGGERYRRTLADNYIRAVEGDRVFDIGCGPATILDYLPQVQYLGFDLNEKYIIDARNRFGHRGTFLCNELEAVAAEKAGNFDIALALGVLHHLVERDAIQLFHLAKRVLTPSGRLITIDGCYLTEQSRFVRYLLANDRGQHVRWQQGYLDLARGAFQNVQVSICNNLLRIPYTHIILECSHEHS